MRLVLIIIVVLVLYYIGFGVYLYINQKKYIYFPDPIANFYDCPLFHNAQKVEFQGTRMYYKERSKNILVHYHGNADTACKAHEIKKIADELHLSHIFVEYAGYAGDKREPSKKLIFQDVRNVHEFLQTKKYEKLFLVGESLGSGAASYHATLAKADKVLLVSPYDRLGNVAKKQYPLYPVNWILTEDYDNISMLQNQSGELLIIYGVQEKVIPTQFGRNLYEKAGFENKDFIEIAKAGHNDIYLFQETLETIKNFLQ